MSIGETPPKVNVEYPPELLDDTDDTNFVPAPCQVACPIGTDAPSYIGYIWEDRIEEAYEAITATNPFSSICEPSTAFKKNSCFFCSFEMASSGSGNYIQKYTMKLVRFAYRDYYRFQK